MWLGECFICYTGNSNSIFKSNTVRIQWKRAQKGKGDKAFRRNKAESRYSVKQKGEGKQEKHKPLWGGFSNLPGFSALALSMLSSKGHNTGMHWCCMVPGLVGRSGRMNLISCHFFSAGILTAFVLTSASESIFSSLSVFFNIRYVFS